MPKTILKVFSNPGSAFSDIKNYSSLHSLKSLALILVVSAVFVSTYVFVSSSHSFLEKLHSITFFLVSASLLVLISLFLNSFFSNLFAKKFFKGKGNLDSTVRLIAYSKGIVLFSSFVFVILGFFQLFFSSNPLLFSPAFILPLSGIFLQLLEKVISYPITSEFFALPLIFLFLAVLQTIVQGKAIQSAHSIKSVEAGIVSIYAMVISNALLLIPSILLLT